MADATASVTLRALKAACDARIPAMLVGPPGVGKTAVIRAMATSMGYELVTLLGSQMDPTDVSGLPKAEVVAHNSAGDPISGTVFLAPYWQVRAITKKKVILFFDEFSNTSPATRAALLTLFQNREFANGEKLPDETIILGAMNPTEEAADGWTLDKPTTNRMLFLVWTTPNDDWFKGMLEAFGEEVSEHEMKWRTRIVSFLRDNPNFIQKENGAVPESGEALGVDLKNPSEKEVLMYAWSSRRSWDNLSKVLGGMEPGDITAEDTIAAGMVGRSSALRFREWLLQNDGLEPAEIFANPTKVNWSEIDLSDANMIFRYVIDNITADNWRKVVELLDAVAKDKSQGLIAPFINDILQAVVKTTRKQGDKAMEVARNTLLGALKNYDFSNRPK